MLQTADQTLYADDSSRRRSTFYVPLNGEGGSIENLEVKEIKASKEQIYNGDLSNYSCDWSLNETPDMMVSSREKSQLSSDDSNKLKRYGIVLNGSVNIDDSNLEVHANHNKQKTSTKPITSSTPIKMAPIAVISEIKEKSKTLPVKETPIAANTFPLKSSFLLKSTPKIASSFLNYSSLSDSSAIINGEHRSSPKKSLSFIRRTHSTKLSRSNSLLKSLTSKCVEQSNENLRVNVHDLMSDRLETILRSDKSDELIKDLFFRETLDLTTKEQNDDDDVHSGKKNVTYLQSIKLVLIIL